MQKYFFDRLTFGSKTYLLLVSRVKVINYVGYNFLKRVTSVLDREYKNPQKKQEVQGDIHCQKIRMNRISISSRDEDTGMTEDERKWEMV